MENHHATDEIGIFTERGGTIAFYIYKDGIVVVDAQWPEQVSISLQS